MSKRNKNKKDNQELDTYKMMENMELHKVLCEKIHNTCVAKNKDYGNSAALTYNKYGMVSYLVRMEDKINRIKSLTVDKNQQQVKDESVLDTLLDLSNYCLLAAIDLIKENK